MIPLPCRILVWTASWLTPSGKRAAWKSEWNAELWHRAETGASPGELLRRSWGVFRDAAWMLETERKANGLDPFRTPLRVEAIFLAAALLICFSAGGLRAPRLPYSDAAQLATLDRSAAFKGKIDPAIRPALARILEQGENLSGMARYRFAERTLSNLWVSRNFFDLLGTRPALGRVFHADDADTVAVLTHEAWRRMLHADPKALGRIVTLGGTRYSVVGVMPPDFWFRSGRVRFFSPLPRMAKATEAVVRVKPGVAFPVAQEDMQKVTGKIESAAFAKTLVLVPLLRDARLSKIMFALELALIGGLLGIGFLALKQQGGARYRAMLGGRIALTVLGLFYIRESLAVNDRGSSFSSSFFAFWIFLLVCSAAACLLAIDHRGRCPACLRRLKKPVSIGTWASQLLDQPATEYLCPSGHGTLYVSETGNAPNHWTVFDESWQDLFAHTDK